MHRITFFGKLAEIVGQYLKKGRSVYVEGRLKTRKYKDKDGVKNYATVSCTRSPAPRSPCGAPSTGTPSGQWV